MDRRYFLKMIGTAGGTSAFSALAYAAMPVLKGKPRFLKVIGVGGAGGHLVTLLKREATDNIWETLCIDTDSDALDKCSADRKLRIGQGGCLTVPHHARAQTQASFDRSQIRSAVSGSDVVFVVAGMGGKAGTRLTTSIIRWARRTNAFVITLLITPFDFEGRRNMHADAGMVLAQVDAHVAFTISNKAFSCAAKEGASLLQAFTASDRAALNAMRTIILRADSWITVSPESNHEGDLSAVINYCRLTENTITSKTVNLKAWLSEIRRLIEGIRELNLDLGGPERIRFDYPGFANGKTFPTEDECWRMDQRRVLMVRLEVAFATMWSLSEDIKALQNNLEWVANRHNIEVILPAAKINDLLAQAGERILELNGSNSLLVGYRIEPPPDLQPSAVFLLLEPQDA